MESSKRLIAFDLDGTLNKTEVYALDAYRNTFKELGIGPFSDEEILDRFGATHDEDIKYFLGNDVTENQAKKYSNTLDRYWQEAQRNKCESYPMVANTLQSLKENGYYLCICSNAPYDEIVGTLKRLDLYDYFDDIQGLTTECDKVYSLRELVKKHEPHSLTMVGDRYYDYLAARENQATFIGCAYGYGKDEELKHADYVIHSIQEIESVMKVIC